MQTRERPPRKVDLRLFDTREGLPLGDNGRANLPVRALWLLVNAFVFRNSLIGAPRLKAWLLRRFGARVGRDVTVRPAVNISRPWNLTIGDHCWVGERSFLDASGPLTIGSHVVISEGAYLACGTHDWKDPAMGSMIAPIVVEDGAWIGPFARIAGNVTVRREALVRLGAVVFTDCQAAGIYAGNPARKVGDRELGEPGPPPRRNGAAPPQASRAARAEAA